MKRLLARSSGQKVRRVLRPRPERRSPLTGVTTMTTVGAHYYLGRPLPFPSAPKRRRPSSPPVDPLPRPSSTLSFFERSSSQSSFNFNSKRPKRWSSISSLSSLSSLTLSRPQSPSLSSVLFSRPVSPSSSRLSPSKRYSVASLPPISLPLAPPLRLEEQIGEVYGELVDVGEMRRREDARRRRKSELMRACGNCVIGEEPRQPEMVQVHTFGTAY